MKKMLKKNFQYGALLSSLLFALSSMSACTDYLDEYDSQYKDLYGDGAKIDGDTPEYSTECDNILWLAYDGKDYMEETTLGTKWEYFYKSPSEIDFSGVNSEKYKFKTNYLGEKLSPYLVLNGGIAGELKIQSGAKDFYAGLRFGLNDLELSDRASYSGVCLTFRTSYYETTMNLMELDESGDIVSEYRTDPIGEVSGMSKVKTVKLPFESFKRKSGEKSFDKFLEKANSLGILFTSTTKNDDGFLIVGVGTYSDGSFVKPESSESGSDTQTSSTSKTSSSASTAKSSDSKVKSSSSAKSEARTLTESELGSCKANPQDVYVNETVQWIYTRGTALPTAKESNTATFSWNLAGGEPSSSTLKGKAGGMTVSTTYKSGGVKRANLFITLADGSEGSIKCGQVTVSKPSSSKSESSSSSTDIFHWRGDSNEYQIHTTFEDDRSGWWFSYTDESSYFQWPVDNKQGILGTNPKIEEVVKECKGICGVSHIRKSSNSTPYASVAFDVTSEEYVDVSNKWEGLCVSYMSKTPIKLRLIVDSANARKRDYQVPYIVLEATDAGDAFEAKRFKWSDFSYDSLASSKLTGIEAAKDLKQISFLFEDLLHPDAYFNILEVGEYGSCNVTEDENYKYIDVTGIMIKDSLDVASFYDAGIEDKDILWYGANLYNTGKSTSDEVKWTWVDTSANDVIWPKNVSSPNMDSFVDKCDGGICGTIDNQDKQYGFLTFGIDFADDVDLTSFGGFCVTHNVSTDLAFELQIVAEHDYYYNDLEANGYRATIKGAGEPTTTCVPWNVFHQNDLVGHKVKLGEYLTHKKGLEIAINSAVDWGIDEQKFNIIAIGKYSDNSENGQKFLNSKENSASAWDFLNPGLMYDNLVDSRDGQVYKTIQIGEQVWMAENLNYTDSNKTESLMGNIACRANLNNATDCSGTYGTNYNWNAIANACPAGWRIPTGKDAQTLIDFVGNENVQKLISSNDLLESYKGSNDVGFSAIPSMSNGVAEFWTSFVYDGSALVLTLWNGEDESSLSLSQNASISGNSYYPIRCIQSKSETEIPNSDLAWYGGNKINGATSYLVNTGLFSDDHVGTTDFHNRNVTVPGNDGLEQYDTYPETSIELCGGAICGTVVKRDADDEYPVITFNVSSAGKDITDWGGFCATYSADSAGVQFSVGNDAGTYYVVDLPKSVKDTTVCYSWTDFYQVGQKSDATIGKFLQNIKFVGFNLFKLLGGGNFKIGAVGKYPEGCDAYLLSMSSSSGDLNSSSSETSSDDSPIDASSSSNSSLAPISTP